MRGFEKLYPGHFSTPIEFSLEGNLLLIHSFSDIDDSVVMDYCNIGRHARIRRAIIDKNVHIPEGEVIGYDLEQDRKRFFVTESGIVVIPKSPKHDGTFH